jgi:hypothetical protein
MQLNIEEAEKGAHPYPPARRGGQNMIKTAMLSLIVILLLFPFFVSSHVSTKARLNEDQALKTLLSSIEKDRLYGSYPTSCLSVLAGEKEKGYYEFRVYKNHGGGCPGNPNVSPKIDRFTVDRSTKKVQWQDEKGELRTIEAFKKSRSRT